MDAKPRVDGRPPGALPYGYARHEGPPRPRPVWVDLTRVFPPPPQEASANDQTAARTGEHDRQRSGGAPVGQHGRLNLSVEVIGQLHYWERDTAGHWYGIVDYCIPLRGDFRPAVGVTLGLVPASALRPRDPTPAQ